MNRNIGAPLQPRSPQPPHASRRAKLRAHRARHGNPADRRLDTKSTPLSPPTGTERGPHNRTPAPTTQRSKAPPRGRPAAAPTTPSQVGGNRDRTAPPQARQTEHGTGAGHAEGHGPYGTALPAPSAGTTRDARATPPSGERTPRERERTHTKRTRGDHQKGNRTERAERTDRMEWHTSERGYGTPGRDGPPHAARNTRGGKGEEGETQHQVPARTPPNRPRAPRTHRRDTAPAKAVVAHSATPQPLG